MDSQRNSLSRADGLDIDDTDNDLITAVFKRDGRTIKLPMVVCHETQPVRWTCSAFARYARGVSPTSDDAERLEAFSDCFRRDLVKELGAQIGRTPESISNIERGLQLPSIETLVELGQALGIPASELLEGVGASGIQHSPKRLELELRLRDITRTLSDRALAVAVAQVDVLLQEQI